MNTRSQVDTPSQLKGKEVHNDDERQQHSERNCVSSVQCTQTLMSVGSMADAGFDCILSKDGGVMRDRDSGEEVPLIRRGNLYVLRAWVKCAESAFGRQS